MRVFVCVCVCGGGGGLIWSVDCHWYCHDNSPARYLYTCTYFHGVIQGTNDCQIAIQDEDWLWCGTTA